MKHTIQHTVSCWREVESNGNSSTQVWRSLSRTGHGTDKTGDVFNELSQDVGIDHKMTAVRRVVP